MILGSHWPSVEYKNFTVELRLLEILYAVGSLCLARDCARLFKSRHAPLLIGNSAACVRLGFFWRVALNPAADERAASFDSVLAGALRARLKPEIKHRHSNDDTV